MKKLLTLLIVGVLTTSGAAAQGNWLLSGTLGFDYSGPELIDGKKNGVSSLDFFVAPSLLYGFSNHFYFGGELSANMRYNYLYQNNEQISDTYRNMFGIAPIARCYFHTHRRIAFFNDHKVGFYLGSDKAKTTYMNITASITPGIEVFLSSRYSVSAALRDVLAFDYERASPDDSDTSTGRINFRFLFNRMELNYAPLTFSFTYHFPQQKVIEIVEIDEIRMR
jgi:hypothetical protein